MHSFIIFFQFLIGHALADFALQFGAMGAGKNRHNGIQQKMGKHFPPWYYWLSAHALIHGGVVYYITDNWWLGLIETVLHWIIDFAKCEGWINFHQDQALHVGCKFGYCFFI